MPAARPTRIFTFDVNEEGAFEYTPKDKWEYNHTDIIRFQTNTGTFRIAFQPVDPPNGSDVLGGPLSGAQHGGKGPWFVDTHVTDSFDPDERKAIRLGNISEDDPEGFVGRYRYVIDVIRHSDGETFHDDERNGQYSC